MRADKKAADTLAKADADKLKELLQRQQLITGPDGKVYLLAQLQPGEIDVVQQQLAQANVAAVETIEPAQDRRGAIHILYRNVFLCP